MHVWTTAKGSADSPRAFFTGSAEKLRSGYRYGRALTKIGDDETVRHIEKFLRTEDLPPHIRQWLERISKGVNQSWKKTTEKWPGPWSHAHGTIEELDGEIVFDDGTRRSAKLSLWCRYRSGPSEHSAWGGVVEPSDGTRLFGRLGRIELQIPGRKKATANICASRGSSFNPHLTIGGSSPYPEAERLQEKKGEETLVDVVAGIFRDSGIRLRNEDSEKVIQAIQKVLERSELTQLEDPDKVLNFSRETGFAIFFVDRINANNKQWIRRKGTAKAAD